MGSNYFRRERKKKNNFSQINRISCPRKTKKKKIWKPKKEYFILLIGWFYFSRNVDIAALSLKDAVSKGLSILSRLPRQHSFSRQV